MFNLFETTNMPYSRPLIASYATVEEAKGRILAIDAAAFIEDDADHAGCADAYLPASGRLMAIEPEGFTLATSSPAFVEKTRTDAKAHAATMADAAAAFDLEFLR